MNDTIDLSSIVKDLGLSDVPVEMQQEIIVKLGETALKNSLVTVIDLLPEDLLSEFEKLTESADMEKTRYFLQKNIPDFDRIMKNEVKKVVDDFKRIKAGMS